MDLATCFRRLEVRGEAATVAAFASCRKAIVRCFHPVLQLRCTPGHPSSVKAGFDESFFCYLEDVDLGFRLRLRGERCVQVRRAEVLHAGSAISGHLSDFSVFHSYRNRIWLFAKNVPGPLLPPILAMQSAAIALVAGATHGATLSTRRPERGLGRVEGAAFGAKKPDARSAIPCEIDR